MAWDPHLTGWVKLNMDGSWRSEPGSLAAGDVLRDHNSKWLRGFCAHKESGNPLEAEIWAILFGINMAWSAGYRKVLVESDSLKVVSLIQFDCNANKPLWVMVQSCRRMLNRDWNYQLSHVFRECNSLTDGLAYMGHSLHNQTCFFSCGTGSI
ncbi:hypothetical protein ACOSQ2_018576 [Xanthoceras sorbifolium]